MKTKKWLIRSTALVAVFTLVSLCFVSGTYAKYTSQVAGSDSARVAKFNPSKVNVDGVEFTKEEATIGVFATQYGQNGAIASKDSDKVVAPGAEGKFTIVIVADTTSEVKYKTEFDFQLTNLNNIPLEFAVVANGTEPQIGDWKTSASDINDVIKALYAPENGGTAGQIDVYWRWKFESGADESDTALGVAGTASVKVKIVATYTQIAPTK